jgi:hypothetical protein
MPIGDHSMSINWKSFFATRGLLLILVVQMVASIGCLYWSYKFQSLYDSRIAKHEKLKLTMNDFKCDQINKDVVLLVSKNYEEGAKTDSELLFWFGILLAWTSGIALFCNYRNNISTTHPAVNIPN